MRLRGWRALLSFCHCSSSTILPYNAIVAGTRIHSGRPVPRDELLLHDGSGLCFEAVTVLVKCCYQVRPSPVCYTTFSCLSNTRSYHCRSASFLCSHHIVSSFGEPEPLDGTGIFIAQDYHDQHLLMALRVEQHQHIGIHDCIRGTLFCGFSARRSQAHGLCLS